MPVIYIHIGGGGWCPRKAPLRARSTSESVTTFETNCFFFSNKVFWDKCRLSPIILFFILLDKFEKVAGIQYSGLNLGFDSCFAEIVRCVGTRTGISLKRRIHRGYNMRG